MPQRSFTLLDYILDVILGNSDPMYSFEYNGYVYSFEYAESMSKNNYIGKWF